MKKILIFLAALLPAVALLYFSLTRDPRALPSALVNRPAPTMELKTLEGETFSLSEMKGKPVVLNFWSTWCRPCIAEHRLIQEAAKIYSKILFYSVLYEDTAENAKAFLDRHGRGAPILLDPNLRTAIDYGVSGVPETFFINRQGTVVYKHAGMLTPDLLFEKIGLLERGGEP